MASGLILGLFLHSYFLPEAYPATFLVCIMVPLFCLINAIMFKKGCSTFS